MKEGRKRRGVRNCAGSDSIVCIPCFVPWFGFRDRRLIDYCIRRHWNKYQDTLVRITKMKIKEEEGPEGGRRRSGRLAKARGAKKNCMSRDEDETSNDQQTQSLSATPSQSNTPTQVTSPSIMSPSDQVTNGENANHTNHCPSILVQAPAVAPPARPIVSIPKETEPVPPFTRIEENVYLFDRYVVLIHSIQL